jgi:hypothetical protein
MVLMTVWIHVCILSSYGYLASEYQRLIADPVVKMG